jgi:hypothetical protein
VLIDLDFRGDIDAASRIDIAGDSISASSSSSSSSYALRATAISGAFAISGGASLNSSSSNSSNSYALHAQIISGAFTIAGGASLSSSSSSSTGRSFALHATAMSGNVNSTRAMCRVSSRCACWTRYLEPVPVLV